MIRLFLYSIITASLCTASPPLHPRASRDVVTSGLYSIQGCGTNASQILSIISSIRTFLQPAITDTTHTPTSPAYTTFFKSIHHAPFVRKILQNIPSGTPVLPGLPQPGFYRVSSPVIACMPDPPLTNPLSDLVGLRPWVQAFARRDCAKELSGDKPFGLFVGGTNIVVLCPAWFTYALTVPSEPKSPPRPCIGVDKTRNEFRGVGYSLAQNLRLWLIHELVHVYVVAATNKRVPVDEVYAVNDCFALSAGEQKYMPNNYVYYAGSVYYKCTNFPTVSLPDRELLTSNSSSSSLSNATNDTVCINNTVGITTLP